MGCIATNSQNNPLASKVLVDEAEIQTISNIQHINVKIKRSRYKRSFCWKRSKAAAKLKRRSVFLMRSVLVVRYCRCLKYGRLGFFAQSKYGVYKFRTRSLICYYSVFYWGTFFFALSHHRWANLYTETRFVAPNKPDGIKEFSQKRTMYL